jgi:1-acyl-sn-glycerol-3-phosphate acyltransferase
MEEFNYVIIIGVVIALGYLLYSLWRACAIANLVDWGGPVENFIDGLNRIFCRLVHKLEYVDINLPEKGGAILVSNHVSGLDPLILIASARRRIHFLSAREQYERWWLNWLFRYAGCIPVDRSHRPDQAFRAALRSLNEGHVIALFPHGKIHLDTDPEIKLKGGAVKLAQLSGCPIYPFRIDGVRGEGMTVMAPFLPSQARVRGLPVLNCSADTDSEECCRELARRLRPNP